MTDRLLLRLASCGLLALLAAGCASCLHPALRAPTGRAEWHFESDPAAAGWTAEGAYQFEGPKPLGLWSPTGGVANSGCLMLRRGVWQTPPLPVTPFAFYRARFTARSGRMGFYAFRFFDAAGKELACDEHSAIDPDPAWQPHEVYTQAREDAASVRLAFIPGDGPPRPEGVIWIDDVSVAESSPRRVLKAGDRLYQALPPLAWTPPPDRWRHLERTRSALREGRELRVVLLGDSIANDMSNAQFHLLVQRHYPGARITLLRSIKGGTGCSYFQHHVEGYVASRDPDLVIIAGISHRCDATAIRSVVEQTRLLEGRPVEFLVLTGAIIEPGMDFSFKMKGMDSPTPEVRAAAVEKEKAFYAALREMENELGIATLDMRAVWEDYLAASGKPRAWFQRDFVHSNNRGKQILARIMERYFQPDDQP